MTHTQSFGQTQTWILEYSPIAPWELDSGFIPRNR